MKKVESGSSAAIVNDDAFGRTDCNRSASQSKVRFGMTALWPVVLALGVGYGAAQAQSVNGGGVQSAAGSVDLSKYCALPENTLIGQVTGNQKALTLPDGTQILASPNQRISLTNNDTHTTVSYLITGTSKYTPVGNDLYYVTSNGKNLLLVPLANGHPAGLFLTTGTVNYVITTAGGGGEVRTFTGPGTVVDVCKVLTA